MSINDNLLPIKKNDINVNLSKCMIRNIVLLSCGFFGIFMAFNTAQSLSTSLGGTSSTSNQTHNKSLISHNTSNKTSHSSDTSLWGNYCLGTLYGVFTLISFMFNCLLLLFSI